MSGITSKTWTVAAVLCGSALLFGVFASAAAADSTLVLTEPNKGTTFHFVDNPPYYKNFSPGDEIVSTDAVLEAGQRVGKVRIVCTATGTGRTIDSAGFFCQAAYKIRKSMLFVSAMLTESRTTEGAVTGGTGDFAGARGTFVSTLGKRSSLTTITLIG